MSLIQKHQRPLALSQHFQACCCQHHNKRPTAETLEPSRMENSCLVHRGRNDIISRRRRRDGTCRRQALQNSTLWTSSSSSSSSSVLSRILFLYGYIWFLCDVYRQGGGTPSLLLLLPFQPVLAFSSSSANAAPRRNAPTARSCFPTEKEQFLGCSFWWTSTKRRRRINQKRSRKGGHSIALEGRGDGSDEDDDYNDDTPETNLEIAAANGGGADDADASSSMDGNDAITISKEQFLETQQRMDRQEKQIAQLLELMSNQAAIQSRQPPSPVTKNEAAIVPLKAMLFIDGTWLYYSLHEREPYICPLIQRFGRAWQRRYSIDWSLLPRILCDSLQDPGWSSSAATLATTDYVSAAPPPRRPVEITRVCVFTSYKADTQATSYRYQMFEDMKEANYDVMQLETVGRSEKCVDIQLAVEVLHYATVPDAYDVAIILTGDKDIMPAMVRTRQKGRKVALVSMKRGCNRALYETPGIKDYDVIWLEDSLEQWVVPKPSTGDGDESSEESLNVVSLFTIGKIIYDFIDLSGLRQVNSRDIGRYLKAITIGEWSVLEHVKFNYGGLKQMLTMSGMFDCDEMDDRGRRDRDRGYYVYLNGKAKEAMMLEAKRTHLSQEEKAFFEAYSTDLLKDRQTAYFVTMGGVGYVKPLDDGSDGKDDSAKAQEMELPKELTRDYTQCTVDELKERCRQRKLKVGGIKADILERVQNDVEEEVARLKLGQQKPQRLAQNGTRSSKRFSTPPEHVASHLQDLVAEILQARGGTASSREVGRYLAAASQAASEGPNGASIKERISALQQLKIIYGNLKKFVHYYPEKFGIDEDVEEDPEDDDVNNKYAFHIRLATTSSSRK